MALATSNKAGAAICALALLFLSSTSVLAEQQGEKRLSRALQIEVVNGTEKEQRAKAQLARLIETYDIDHWMFTNRIAIDDKEWIPHSHPVLTLNSRYLEDDEAQLATLLHEQFHWYAETVQARLSDAIAEFRQIFPEVPVGPGGTRSEYSTYLHLIICDLEYQALETLLGAAAARRVLENWKHYSWVYERVLHDPTVRQVNTAHGLIAHTASTGSTDHNPHPLASHLAYRLRGSGEWRTPNPDHDPSDPNSPAVFGVNLQWAPERQHVVGEVVGLTSDGRTARYQTFYVVLNPETRKVIVQQIGWDGAYSYGEQELRNAELFDGDSDVLDMRVVGASRSAHFVRHRDTVLDPDRYRSEVFIQGEDGAWELQRQWIWQRVREEDGGYSK